MLLFSSILLILLQFNHYGTAQRLIGTHIIFRHGERSPTYLYGNNPNDPQFWSNGLGQLTVRGQLQQVALGQYFRERYSNLINSTYVATEINIRSSDYDRTLMSAYSNLVGLYPTSDTMPLSAQLLQSNQWPKSLPWQPIPVHTVPRSMDHLMGVSSCARYEELVEEMRQTPRIRNFNNQFRDLFDYLEKQTNQTMDDIFIVWDVADSALIEALYNVTPSWITPTVLQQLRYVEDLSFYHLFYSSEINRLRGGPFLYDIMENVRNLIAKSDKGRKMKLYSGHDTSISSVLAFLGVNYIHQPSFASALFFDLYELDDRSFGIQLEYLNTTNSRTTQTIRIPGCSDDLCPVERLLRLYQSKIPTNMDQECQTMTNKNIRSRVHYPFL